MSSASGAASTSAAISTARPEVAGVHRERRRQRVQGRCAPPVVLIRLRMFCRNAVARSGSRQHPELVGRPRQRPRHHLGLGQRGGIDGGQHRIRLAAAALPGQRVAQRQPRIEASGPRSSAARGRAVRSALRSPSRSACWAAATTSSTGCGCVAVQGQHRQPQSVGEIRRMLGRPAGRPPRCAAAAVVGRIGGPGPLARRTAGGRRSRTGPTGVAARARVPAPLAPPRDRVSRPRRTPSRSADAAAASASAPRKLQQPSRARGVHSRGDGTSSSSRGVQCAHRPGFGLVERVDPRPAGRRPTAR